MDSLDVVSLTRSLVDIDSTSGSEAAASRMISSWLRTRDYCVVEQAVPDERSPGRFNVLATLDPPKVVLSTHIDTVPPYFPSRIEGELLYGRGACDAKGILAAQLIALERLRAEGERRVGLLAVVGEEDGSAGARHANHHPVGSRYLVNGEPTNNRLGRATRGVYRVRLTATGRTAHSSHPEQGESAIEKVLDALLRLRSLELPEHEDMGRTNYTVVNISGGIAPNVVPPKAGAEINFRTVSPASDVRTALDPLLGLVALEDVVEVPPVELKTLGGFDTATFRFTTDIPFLSEWGTPLLFGPGDILAAHTADEHVRIPELHDAVDRYVDICRTLLSE